MQNKKNTFEIMKTLTARWPDASCELLHNNGFQLLIAVVLSAQTTDKSVNQALAPLFHACPHFGPQDLVDMGEEGFLKAIRRIGLAPTKARNALKIASILLDSFQGQVPRSRQDLESLPGVGRKTASVILNVLYGEATVAVDTHVARLACRIGLVAPTENRNQIEDELLLKIPSEFLQQGHHVLIFHGRYLCTARNPQCGKCPIEQICEKNGLV